MARRIAWIAAAASVVGVAATWFVREAAPPLGGVPSCTGCNLLLVTIDTLRVDRVGVYGSGRGLTPAIDGLAERGIRFETVRSPAPLTLPAHTSLLTGTEPPRHGVRDNGIFRFDGGLPTLAGTLREQGYATGAFVGSFVLDSRFGLATGFDVYDDQWGGVAGDTRAAAERSADVVTSSAQRWIGERDDTRPWFAWVHLYDPHAPYEPPAAFQEPGQPYDGEVAFADAMLGQLLATMIRGRRTVVVVTSDHGESLGEHDEEAHGVFAYDATLRVPLIVTLPEASGGTAASPRVVSEPARLIDVAPTLLEVLGVDVPSSMTGRPLLRGAEAGARAGVTTYFESWHASLTRGWAPLSGVVHEELKFIDLPLAELYDLAHDPFELDNLLERRPKDAERLRLLMTEHRGALGREDIPSARTEPDAAARRALAALGYVAGRAPGRRGAITEADDPKRRMPVARRVDQVLERFDSGERGAAVEELRTLADREPRDAYVVGSFAAVLRASGRLSEAVDVLGGAVDTLADPSLQVQLARDLADVGRFGDAIARLERVLGQHADYIDARLALGIVYARAGRLAEARTELMAVVALDETAAEALDGLGVVASRLGRRGDAEAWFRRAIEADARLVTARVNLAFLLVRSGRRDEAIATWLAVLADEPDHPDTLFNLGLALDEAARPAEARPMFERFLAVSNAQQYAQARARARRWLERGR